MKKKRVRLDHVIAKGVFDYCFCGDPMEVRLKFARAMLRKVGPALAEQMARDISKRLLQVWSNAGIKFSAADQAALAERETEDIKYALRRAGMKGIK